MDKIPTIEYIYTLKKSIIARAFNQPKEAYDGDVSFKRCGERRKCVDHFLIWYHTHEKRDFWSNLEHEIRYE